MMSALTAADKRKLAIWHGVIANLSWISGILKRIMRSTSLCCSLLLMLGCTASRPATESADQSRRIVQDILNLWTWSYFWSEQLLFFPKDGTAINASNYPVGRKIQPVVFWHDPAIGMCSRELDLCVVYVKGLKGTLHEIALTHKLPDG